MENWYTIVNAWMYSLHYNDSCYLRQWFMISFSSRFCDGNFIGNASIVRSTSVITHLNQLLDVIALCQHCWFATLDGCFCVGIQIIHLLVIATQRVLRTGHFARRTGRREAGIERVTRQRSDSPNATPPQLNCRPIIDLNVVITVSYLLLSNGNVLQLRKRMTRL